MCMHEELSSTRETALSWARRRWVLKRAAWHFCLPICHPASAARLACERLRHSQFTPARNQQPTSSTMAALMSSSLRASTALKANACRPRVASLAAVPRPAAPQLRRSVLARAQDTEQAPDVDKLVKDLQDKWDKVENKTSVVLYGAGAIVLVWFSGTLVSALDAIPLLPKLMELVGLGYTSWFVYRYLLFKSSREELVKDVDELKKKITGEGEAAAAAIRAPAAASPLSAAAPPKVATSTKAAADE